MISRKPKSHIFRLGFNVKIEPRSEQEHSVYIWHSYGSSKTKRKIFKAPMNEWDFSNKKGHFKSHVWDKPEYKEKVKWINNFHKEASNMALKLAMDEIKLDDAIKILKNEHTTGEVLKSFEKNCLDHKDYKRKKSAVIKYYKAIITVTNHLRRNDFFKGKYRSILQIDENGEEKTIRKEITELDYEHLQNLTDRRKIEDILASLPIKNASKNDYLDAMNIACKVNPKISLIPFDLFVETDDKKAVRRPPIKRRDLQEGIINIKDNYYHLEAYLYFLFSFSLRGLNGSDICMLNEDWLETSTGSKEFNLGVDSHYHPDYDKLIKNKRKFSEKIYIVGKRNKTKKKGSEIKILLNQFPTLVIHKLLKRCINYNRPYLAYKGKDKIKLYNIDYKTPKGAQRFKDLLGNYSKAFKKLTGGTCGQSRHTFSKYVKMLGVEPELLSISLGHIERSKTRDYYVAEKSQIELDIIHTEVLKKIDINHLLNLIFKVTKDKKLEVNVNLTDNHPHMVDKKEKEKINIIDFKYQFTKTPDGKVYEYEKPNIEFETRKKRGTKKINLSWCNTNELEQEALKLPLTSWDYTKEIKLQTMLEDERDNLNIYVDENGNVIRNENVQYSPELKLLMDEKKFVLTKEFNKRQNKGQSIDEFIEDHLPTKKINHEFSK